MTSKQRADENTDEFIRRMELEDELDAAEQGLTKMTPIEYARAKGIKPQLVYYYVRAGHIKVEVCVCGRRVIDVASANAYLQEKEEIARSRLGAADTE